MIRDSAVDDATKTERSRIAEALRAICAQTDADPRSVAVTTDSVTMPHEVLEALVLGDQQGVAAVLDGQAFLADAVREARDGRR